jgi:predicted dehydrogenase
MLRIGVAGLGTIGQTHVAALRDLGVPVSGADPSPAARDRLRQDLVECYASWEQLLENGQLDGLVIATPPRTHRQIATAALEAGLGVLCEKPLALTVDDCQAIESAAVQSGRPLFVGFCHRFQPQVSALRELLHAGALGELRLVSVSFVHGLSLEGRAWIAERNEAGGGVLFDSGSHALDLFRYLAGDVDAVRGLSVGAAVEDMCVVSLRADHVLGTVTLAWNTPPWRGTVEVIGSRAQARVDYEGDAARLRLRVGDGPWRSVRTARTSRFVLQMRSFLKALRGGPSVAATAFDGKEATRLILSVYDQHT